MKHASDHVKLQVLGALESAPGKTKKERLKHVEGLSFRDKDGTLRSFTWSTIQTWAWRYKEYGYTFALPKTRVDKGMPRKTTPGEALEAINTVKSQFHGKRYTKTDIYRRCIEQGLLKADQISCTTFLRFIREHDLLDRDDNENQKKMRKAFCMPHANDLWQADTMYGPYITNSNGKKQRTYLIAFIDDASRVISHGEFFFAENTDNLIQALRKAFFKRGTPRQLYVDNGSIYCSLEIIQICSRTSCTLRHTPVRDGAAKGKIERFFRRVRDQFLSRKLDISSLEVINRQFNNWVEDEYHATIHAGINMKPIDRFGLDLSRISFLPPSEATDELFFAEDERKVKNDNTFNFKNVRYETPVQLAGKKIQVRYSRTSCDRIIIYYKGQRMGEARQLNQIANGRLGKEKS